MIKMLEKIEEKKLHNYEIDIECQIIDEESNYDELVDTFGEDRLIELDDHYAVICESEDEAGEDGVWNLIYIIADAIELPELFNSARVTDNKDPYSDMGTNIITFVVEDCPFTEEEVVDKLNNYSRRTIDGESHNEISDGGKSCEYNVKYTFELGKVTDITELFGEEELRQALR